MSLIKYPHYSSNTHTSQQIPPPLIKYPHSSSNTHNSQQIPPLLIKYLHPLSNTHTPAQITIQIQESQWCYRTLWELSLTICCILCLNLLRGKLREQNEERHWTLHTNFTEELFNEKALHAGFSISVSWLDQYVGSRLRISERNTSCSFLIWRETVAVFHVNDLALDKFNLDFPSH